jgi:hypothetical protein
LGGAVGKRAASERRPAVGSGRAALEFVRKRDREAADDGRGFFFLNKLDIYINIRDLDTSLHGSQQ